MTTADDPAAADRPDRPAPVALQVVHGNPTPEELAALITVVATRAADDPPPPTRSRWGRPLLRGTLHPEPGAWRASALPR